MTYKEETLLEEPLVLMIYDFVTDKEAQSMKKEAYPQVKDHYSHSSSYAIVCTRLL